jgi:hypothetical protein
VRQRGADRADDAREVHVDGADERLDGADRDRAVARHARVGDDDINAAQRRRGARDGAL